MLSLNDLHQMNRNIFTSSTTSSPSGHFFEIRDWLLPLPPDLCRRIDGIKSVGEPGTPPRPYYIRSAWLLEVEGNGMNSLPPTASNGTTHPTTTTPTVQLTNAQQLTSSNSSTITESLAPSSSSPTTASSLTIPPLLSLAELQIALHFITSFFPFGSFDDLLDGLITFTLLWSKSSRSGVPEDEELKIPFEYSTPRILRAELKAELICGGITILQTTLTRSRDSVSLLGRDINKWGDVDILLQVEPASHVSTLTSSSPATIPASSSGVGESPMPCSIGHCHSSPSNHDRPSAGLYCLNLLPLTRIPLHIHKILAESELIYSHGIQIQDSTAPARFGDIHTWERLPHTYFNSTQLMQRILCIDIPMFIPTDENVVDHANYPQLTLPRSTPLPWKQLLPAYAVSSSPVTRSISWTFPGGLPTQRVTFSTNVHMFEASPHAVLLFAYAFENDQHSISAESAPPRHASSDPRLLFVHHSKRGWELPGGKLDTGETPIEAVIREAKEEADVLLHSNSIQLIGQYVIDEIGLERHVKNVYVGRIASIGTQLHHETKATRLLTPPIWQTMKFRDTNAPSSNSTSTEGDATNHIATNNTPPSDELLFSSILRDNIYPIGLELTRAVAIDQRNTL